MLYATTSAADKRRALRAALSSGRIQRFPGAFNPLSAKLIQDRGFEGVYLSGAVMAAELGLPDIGLTSVTEIATRGSQVARMTDLPLLIDADTGFGEPMNVARTVQTLEDAGVAGLHIEDQVNPKRCGHLDGKQVVDTHTAQQRIRAAVQARRDPNLLIMARTDIRATDGFTATVQRGKALIDAGADALFPEALLDLREFEDFRNAVDVPILANMTEFGKSELFSVSRLQDVGVSLVIFPVSLLRLAMGTAANALEVLAGEGTLSSLLPEMQTRTQLYDLLDYSTYNTFDSGVFNFRLDSEADDRNPDPPGSQRNTP